MNLLLVSAVAISTLSGNSDAFDGWEKHWRRYKLTDEQRKTAETQMSAALPLLARIRKVFLAKPQELNPKYDVVDFKASPIKQRLKPLCRLFIVKTILKNGKNILPNANSVKSCSCFFVRPTVAMTAGHCIFPSKWENVDGKKKLVTTDVSPAAGYVTFLVRDYGIEGANEAAHADATKKNAGMATEWWTAAKFDEHFLEQPGELRHADLAFVKVSSALPDSSHLILTQPNGPLGGDPAAVKCNYFDSSSIMILGYPGSYKNGEVAVDVIGHIDKFSEGHVNEVLHYGLMERDGKTVTGSAGSGISGGPMILGTNDKVVLPKDCDMGVFGLNYGGWGENDQFCRSASPLFTKELIQALNIIENVDDANAAGTKVTKKDGDSIQFLELPITV